MITSKKSRDDIINFYECLFTRKFTEAEKALEAVKDGRFGDTEFKKGYTQALEGILLSIRSGDDRDFLIKAPFDKKHLKKYSDDFKVFVQDDGSAPYDVGYFMAWSDLVRYKKDQEGS